MVDIKARLGNIKTRPVRRALAAFETGLGIYNANLVFDAFDVLKADGYSAGDIGRLAVGSAMSLYFLGEGLYGLATAKSYHLSDRAMTRAIAGVTSFFTKKPYGECLQPYIKRDREIDEATAKNQRFFSAEY